MDQEPKQKPKLIYFQTRGNAQLIRCVLLEVGMEFQEIFIPFHGGIDQQIIAKYKIEMRNLPYFIDKGVTMQGIFPIIKYICNLSQRLDLLGKTLKDQITIAELMTKCLREQSVMLTMLFKGLKQIKDKGLGVQGRVALEDKLLQIVKKQKHVQCVRAMYEASSQYLLGYLTLLDFFFYEKVFYGTNMLQKDDKFAELGIRYKKFFQSTDFYKKHAEALCKYKIFFPEMGYELNSILKEMWQGDPKFIACN